MHEIDNVVSPLPGGTVGNRMPPGPSKVRIAIRNYLVAWVMLVVTIVWSVLLIGAIGAVAYTTLATAVQVAEQIFSDEIVAYVWFPTIWFAPSTLVFVFLLRLRPFNKGLREFLKVMFD